MNADSIAPSQPRRHEGTKTSRRHRSLDSRPNGRAATTRSRGIEARKVDLQAQTLVESTFLHLGSCLRRAHPASVDSRSATSFPHVTLSEPLRGASRGVPRSTDSHRSNLFRIQLRWASTPRSRNEIVGAGFTPAPASPRIPAWIPWPPGPVTSHRSPLPGTSCWGGCKTLPYGFSQRQIAGGTPAPQFLPLSKKESTGPASPRRSRCAPSTAGRGIDWTRQKLVFGEFRRFHGGGGRRPQPTPPPENQIRVIREIRVQQLRWCDVICVLSALSAVQTCDGCDDFVCDAFVSSCLRRCDGAMSQSASICVICGFSVRRLRCLRVFAFFLRP